MAPLFLAGLTLNWQDSATAITSNDPAKLPRPAPLKREKAARPPALPASLQARLTGYGWRRNLVGEAGAAVYRLHRHGAPDLYLKHGRNEAAQDLVDEIARLRWLAGHMPVAPLEHFESTGSEAWLLTGAIPGRTAYEWLLQAPERAPEIVTALAHCLAHLHALPAERCPFNASHALRLAQARQRIAAGRVDAADFDEARQGWTPEDVWRAMQGLLPLAPDPVVTHGDYSLDNILLDAEGRVTGVIDLGRIGVADRYQDLAILWNCLAEFGPLAQATLFTAYGIGQPDDRKLTFHLCLDECF